MSYFKSFQKAPSDPIFGLNALLKGDTRTNKIDLLIGYYRDEKGSTPIFKAVHKAEQLLFEKQTDLNYFPIDGHPAYISALKELIFEPSLHPHVYGAQAVGGTSALHHLGKLLAHKGGVKIAIPNPSWANHSQIFKYLGLDVVEYPYYNSHSHQLLWAEMLAYFHSLPEGSCLLLHASCHNPSGIDFSHEQWIELAKLCAAKKFLPVFDCAYQGFGDGLKEDVYSINLFTQCIDEFLLAYSCSKNFGLYGERVGACFVYAKDKNVQEVLSSILKQSMRATYSNPPRQGASIVAEILHSKSLKQLWHEELLSYKDRIHTYRKKTQAALGGEFSYITQAKGLFVYTGLNKEQVTALREKEAIYLATDGRINITGLNENNFDRVIHALKSAL